VKAGLLPPSLFAVALVAQIALHVLVPVRTVVPWPWRALGTLLVVAGVVLNLVADRQFTRACTPVSPRDVPTALITTGPFALSRNPMYAGMVTLLLGLAILLGSLSPFVVPLILGWWLSKWFVRPEEARLARVFGDAYRQYALHVRRWL
jgi:protein-S-isoprenylcysteine O-methyltransferase Ste14